MSKRELGKIVVYTGPMFAMKTGSLIVQYERSLIAGRRVVALKPARDTRFSKGSIVSRRFGKIENAYCITDLKEIKQFEADDYFIDEFQFLKGDIRVIQKMADCGKNFFITGLDMTSEGKPFGIMAKALAIADIVHKETAVCKAPGCDCPAIYSYCLVEKKGDILIGDGEKYIPLCRYHRNQYLEEKKRQMKQNKQKNSK